MKFDLHFNCMDCQCNTLQVTNVAEKPLFYPVWNYYMLQDDLWKQINPQIIGMLCLACVEKRLKRPLVKEDFSITPEEMMDRFINYK